MVSPLAAAPTAAEVSALIASQGLNEDAIAGKLRATFLGYFNLLLQTLQPTRIKQTLIQICSELTAQVITAQPGPAHGQWNTRVLSGCIDLPGSDLNTGQGLYCGTDFRPGKPEVALSPSWL
jgi:hypothetical protein